MSQEIDSPHGLKVHDFFYYKISTSLVRAIDSRADMWSLAVKGDSSEGMWLWLLRATKIFFPPGWVAARKHLATSGSQWQLWVTLMGFKHESNGPGPRTEPMTHFLLYHDASSESACHEASFLLAFPFYELTSFLYYWNLFRLHFQGFASECLYVSIPKGETTTRKCLQKGKQSLPLYQWLLQSQVEVGMMCESHMTSSVLTLQLWFPHHLLGREKNRKTGLWLRWVDHPLCMKY